MGVNSGNKGYIGNNQSDYLSGTISSRQSYLEEDYKFKESINYTYVRPSEWATLPSMTAGSQMIAFVYGVYNNFSNFLSFYVNTTSGNYIVNWGDGTTGSYSSGALASKQYTPTTYSGLTTPEIRGYKTLVVSITPATANLLQFNFRDGFVSYPLTNVRNDRAVMMLDLRMAGSSINYVHIASSRFLEQFDFVGTNSMTYPAYMFSNCNNLENIVSLDLSKATGTLGMFSNCFKLKSLPMLDTRESTNFFSMFGSCHSLVNIPMINTSKATSINQLFFDCRSLITVPPLDTSNVTDFTNVFNSCYALKKVPLLNTSKATTMQGMFFFCSSLVDIPLFDMSNVTNCYQMFYGCYSLRYFPKMNLSKVTTMFQMFWSNRALEKVEDMNTSSCTNFYQMFYSSGIQNAPQIDTSSATNVEGMFGDTNKLQFVPSYDLSKVTMFKYMFLSSALKGWTGTINTATSGITNYNVEAFFGMFDRSNVNFVSNINLSGISTGSAFANVYSNMFSSSPYPSPNLSSLGITGIQHNFDIRNASLGPTALNEIYTSLATVGASGAGAKTIVVTGNWGASAGLGHNPSIAIGKGWTVTT